MKKFAMGLVVGGIISGMLTAAAAQYTATEAGFKVLVNGDEFVSDPPALVVEGRTYLPLRAIGDALGVPVNWNAELSQAEIGSVPTEASTQNTVMSNDNWKVTYSGYKVSGEVNYLTPNNSGNKFLTVFFDVENLTDEEKNFGLGSEFYVDEYKVLSTVVGNTDGAQQCILGINIAPKKKAKIHFTFEVDPSWNKLDIVMADLLETDDTQKLKFTLAK